MVCHKYIGSVAIDEYTNSTSLNNNTVWTESFVRQNFHESLNFADITTKRFSFSMPISLIDCQKITSLSVHK